MLTVAYISRLYVHAMKDAQALPCSRVRMTIQQGQLLHCHTEFVKLISPFVFFVAQHICHARAEMTQQWVASWRGTS